MEIDDRKARLEDNIVAAKKAIVELEANKKQIQQTHNISD